MVNQLITAITTQLGRRFGLDYKYYSEDVEQGLIKPCFHTKPLIPIIRSKSAVLYDRTIPVVVHYFHDNKDDNNEASIAMAEEVIECLEYLPFENTILRGEKISYEIVENVLQVFITYSFTAQKVVDKSDEMQTLTENVAYKK
jgi:hypothetical protein